MALIPDRRVHLPPHRPGLTDHVHQMTQGETMTRFAPYRATVQAFIDSMHGGADNDALAAIFAEDVVLYGPLGDEPVTGREAVLEAMQGVGTVATDLTYNEV